MILRECPPEPVLLDFSFFKRPLGGVNNRLECSVGCASGDSKSGRYTVAGLQLCGQAADAKSFARQMQSGLGKREYRSVEAPEFKEPAILGFPLFRFRHVVRWLQINYQRSRERVKGHPFAAMLLVKFFALVALHCRHRVELRGRATTNNEAPSRPS